MNREFLEFIEFIQAHQSDDPSLLRLKYGHNVPHYMGLSSIDQIICRRKTTNKLHDFLSCPGFLFPSIISAEQCTNEILAQYHASLFCDDDSIADMTAGLGIDSMSISKKVKSVLAIERFKKYCEVLRHNYHQFGLDNLTVINQDSTEWLDKDSEMYDAIFVDPARRGDSNNRVAAFSDCEPDIIPLMDIMLSKAKRVIIKASPMLDVTQVCRELPSLHKLRIVSFKGECKELLADCRQDNFNKGKKRIECVNIDKFGCVRVFECNLKDVGTQPDSFANISSEDIYSYLYEPSPEIMKASPWLSITKKYNGLEKISPETHLFIGNILYQDFPGRILKITGKADKKCLKSLKGEAINVVCRNYPENPITVSHKLGLRSGEDRFLYCFRLKNKKTLRLLAQRLL